MTANDVYSVLNHYIYFSLIYFLVLLFLEPFVVVIIFFKPSEITKGVSKK